jgi:hypothetical protein
MFATTVRIVLRAIHDPARRRAHAEALQLRHLPALRLRRGVDGADAWIRPADEATVRAGGASEFADADFVEMAWSRDSAAPSAGDPAITGPVFDEMFVPVKGEANRRVLVSADALPYRPMRGIHLAISRFARRDAETEDVYRWYDRERVPGLLKCRGAAGAWLFASAALFRPGRDPAAPALRALVVYLDGDTASFRDELVALDARRRDTSGLERVLFAGTLRALTPWRWDRLAG